MHQILSNSRTTLLLFLSIAAGSLTAFGIPSRAEVVGDFIDPLILALVSLIFFEIRMGSLTRTSKHLRFISIAWVANFVFIPLIGWGIASLFLSGKPLLYTGLLIYFIAPCTDWFLGFTRLAKGNTSLGSILIPINLASQLLLYPIFIGLFAGRQSNIAPAEIALSLWQWFFLPFAASLAFHALCHWLLPSRAFEKILSFAGKLITPVICALVFCIFANNSTAISENLTSFCMITLAVFCFFVVTWFFGEWISRTFRLAYPEHALLSMTTAARNAPLMLGLTTAAFPEQPLVYAALIIGMLVEFPHLSILKHLLLKKRTDTSSSASTRRPELQNSLPKTV